VDRKHELVYQLRSIAMFPSNSWAIRREEAIQLLEELQDATDRLDKLRGELRRLAEEG
jgi:hypothetical protein